MNLDNGPRMWSAEHSNVEFGVLIDNRNLTEAVERELGRAEFQFSRLQHSVKAVVDEFDVEGLGFAAVLARTGSFPSDAARVRHVGFGVVDLLHLNGVPPAVAEVVQVARGQGAAQSRFC
nr:hypothetical protein [Actinophytocola sp.]